MKLIRVGVDLAKNVFQVHGVDRSEKTVWRSKLVRADWVKALLAQIEPGCEIGMEACSGAHHWARVLQAHGYKVKLIAPQFVKPYVKSNKNDANDAEAIGKRANSPSAASTWHRCSSMRPIYVSSRTSRPEDGLFANEESIYGNSAVTASALSRAACQATRFGVGLLPLP